MCPSRSTPGSVLCLLSITSSSEGDPSNKPKDGEKGRDAIALRLTPG